MMDDSIDIDDHEEEEEEEEDEDMSRSNNAAEQQPGYFAKNNNEPSNTSSTTAPAPPPAAGSSSATGGGASQDSNDNNVSMMDDSELEAIKARVREMEEEAEKLKQLQSEVDRQMNIGSHHHHHLNNITGSSSSQGGAQLLAATTSSATASSSSSSLLNNNNQSGSGGGGGVVGAPGSLSNSALFPSSLSIEEKMEVDGRSIYVGNVDYGATAEELEQHFHGCGSINRVTILCNKYDGHPKGFSYIEFADKESVNTAMALDESLFRGRQIKVMIKRTNRPGLCRTDRPPRGGTPTIPRGRGRGGRFLGGGFRGSHHRGFPSRRASSIISSSGRIMMTSTRGSSYYSPY